MFRQREGYNYYRSQDPKKCGDNQPALAKSNGQDVAGRCVVRVFLCARV